MLEKLFNLNCLDYSKLLRQLYKKMNIDEKTCLITIAILDSYKETGNIKINDIVSSNIYTISEIENALSVLLEHDYIEIYLNLSFDGKGVEAYRVTPLFKALEKLMTDKVSNSSSISQIIDEIETFTKRPLISQELETITSWFNEGFTFDRIISEINMLKLSKTLSVKNLDKALYKVKDRPKTSGNLKKVFDSIGKD